MFLSDLTELQKAAFYNIAKKLIYSDDILDVNEADLMGKLEREMNMPGSSVPVQENLEESLKTFDSKKSKAVVILELLVLANIDDDFNTEEDGFIKNIADSFGISSIDFSGMKWWAAKKLDVDREASKFF